MKKIWITSISLLLSLAFFAGVAGCGKKKKATISVTVNGTAQTNGGEYGIAVDSAYVIAATSSNDKAVSVSYPMSGITYANSAVTAAEEGSYAFTFTADGAETFRLTFNATRRSPEGQYTVTFGLGAHAAADAESVTQRTVVSGTQINLPAAPKAEEGYVFDGWSDGTNVYPAGAAYTVNSSVTLNAVWNAEAFTVTYVLGANAAAGATAPAQQSANGGIRLPAAVAAADGYIFTGWSDGSKTYNAGAQYTVTGNVTFTAVFASESSVTEFTVSYALGANAAAGATAPAERTVEKNGDITLPAAPAAADGYKFDAWTDGTTKYPAGATYTVKSNVTVTALFKVDEAAPVRGMKNGNFETGDLTGWTVVKGGADSVSVINLTEYWEADENFFDMNGATVQKYNQTGEYFLVTDEKTEVSVKSATFTLGGDGIITFKFGVAKNPVCYVALCDAASGEELVKVANDSFKDPTLAQALLRRVMYATDYIGRSVYIKLVDGATADFGFLNFDDVKVSLTMEEAQEIVSADKQWAQTYRQDVTNSTASMGGKTKDIINAVREYYAALEVQDVKTVLVSKAVTDKAEAAGAKDLTAYLAEAKASMLGVSAETLVKSIVSVSDGANNYTSGFTSFNLQSGKSYTVTYRITDPASGKYAEKTFNISVSSSYEIINGGFETGDLTGWTATGDEFVGVESGMDCWNGLYNQEGNYHLNGWKGAASEKGQGTLKSSVFELGGTGKISFRLGGGNFENGTYISVKRENGTEVARFTNTKQQSKDDAGRGEQYMWVYAFDLTTVTGVSLGDRLYIEIVDCQGNGPDDGVWRLLFADDIKTYHTAESFAALGAQGTDWFAAVNQLTAN